MILSEIRERAYRMMGLDPTAPVFFTDAQMNRYINDAYVDAQLRTKALDIRFTVTPTAGTGTYTLPDYVGQVWRVMYDGYRVSSISTWELDRLDPGWEDREGYVSCYTMDTRDDRVLRLYKKPATSGSGTFTTEYGVALRFSGGNTYAFSSEFGVFISASGGDESFDFEGELGVSTDIDFSGNSIEVWATKNPARLTLDTQSPELPAYVHIALAFDAASRALMRRGDHYNPSLSEAYGAMAEDYSRFMKSLVENRTPEAAEVVGSRANLSPIVVDPTDQTITAS